jgi:hypothetical protein
MIELIKDNPDTNSHAARENVPIRGNNLQNPGLLFNLLRLPSIVERFFRGGKE